MSFFCILLKPSSFSYRQFALTLFAVYLFCSVITYLTMDARTYRSRLPTLWQNLAPSSTGRYTISTAHVMLSLFS